MDHLGNFADVSASNGRPPGPLAGAVAMALPSSRCLCHCRRALPSTGAGSEPFRDLLDPCRHFLTSRHQTNDGNFVLAIDFGSPVLAALGFPGRKGIVETAGGMPSRESRRSAIGALTAPVQD